MSGYHRGMLSKPAKRTFTVWWALAAMLMMALAPTLSLGMQAKAGGSLVELCTALGTRWVTLDAAEPGTAESRPDTPAHLFEHCPYCALHADTLGPAPSVPAVGLLPLNFEAPRLFLAAPRTLHAWLAAQPRGPPRPA